MSMTTAFENEFDETSDQNLGQLLTGVAATELSVATGALTEWVRASKDGDVSATARLKRWESILGVRFRPAGTTWLEACIAALPSVTKENEGVVLDTITYCTYQDEPKAEAFAGTTAALLDYMKRAGASYPVIAALKAVPDASAIPTLLELLADEENASAALKALSSMNPTLLSPALQAFVANGGAVVEKERRAFEILCDDTYEVVPPEGHPVGEAAMLRAAESTNVSLLERGLAEGFDPNADVNRGSVRLLHFAVESAAITKCDDALRAVASLVRAGADVHAAITRDYRDDADDDDPRFRKKDTPASLALSALEHEECIAATRGNRADFAFYERLFEALGVTRETARIAKKTRSKSKSN